MGWGTGSSHPPNNKKMNISGPKIDAFRAKINHMNFICGAQHILLDDYTYYSRNEYHRRL